MLHWQLRQLGDANPEDVEQHGVLQMTGINIARCTGNVIWDHYGSNQRPVIPQWCAPRPAAPSTAQS